MRSHDVVVAWLWCLPFLATYNLFKRIQETYEFRRHAELMGAADQVCSFLQDISRPSWPAWYDSYRMRVAELANNLTQSGSLAL